jgi:hypothetical protein
MPVLIAGTLSHRPRLPNSMSAFEGITGIVTAGAQVRNWTRNGNLLRTKLDPSGATLRNSSVSLIVSRIGGITMRAEDVECRQVLGKIVVGF